jgi:hypothetical protein
VQECLQHFHGERYHQYAYVVMDDHVHSVVQPFSEFELSRITHTWKSYTAHQINRLLAMSGAVWQDECLTRIIRNEEELCQKLHYVLTNPQRRWPDEGDYRWVGWHSG